MHNGVNLRVNLQGYIQQLYFVLPVYLTSMNAFILTYFSKYMVYSEVVFTVTICMPHIVCISAVFKLELFFSYLSKNPHMAISIINVTHIVSMHVFALTPII